MKKILALFALLLPLKAQSAVLINGNQIQPASTITISGIGVTYGVKAATGVFTGNTFTVGGSSFTVGGGSATVAYQMSAASYIGNGALLSNLPSNGHKISTGTLTAGATFFATRAGLVFDGAYFTATDTATLNETFVSISSSIIFLSSTSVLPTRQVFLSGSGTYGTPANVQQLRIRAWGGGGGGGDNTAAGTGGFGGYSTFNAISAGGGGPGGYLVSATTRTTGVGVASMRWPGGMAGGSTSNGTSAGGNSCFGGGGKGGERGGGAGGAGSTNTGGGGGGSMSAGTDSGGGASSGECIDIVINNPVATYSYAVGAGGAGGSTGGNGGGAGAAGGIVVDEYYSQTGPMGATGATGATGAGSETNTFGYNGSTKTFLSTVGMTSATISGQEIVGGSITVQGTGQFGGALSMTSHLINNVTDPVSSQDAATKNYVDLSTTTKVLPTKVPARFGTVAALPSNTYANGSSGVGATLTGLSLGQITIDGVAPSVGDRVLINNEAAASHNGIYVVNVNGVGLFYQFTRVTDFDTPIEMGAGEALFVTSGAVNTDAFFVLLASVTTVGTDSINFAQANGLGDVTAGNGLSKSGNTISVVSTNSAITQLTALNLISNPFTATSSMTITVNAFSVGGTTFAVNGGNVGIGTAPISTATVQISGNVNVSSDTRSYSFTEVESTYNATSGANYNVNFSSGDAQFIVLTANAAITFSNPPTAAGSIKTMTLYLKQDATGTRIPTWPTMKWPANTAPTLTTTAGKIDIITVQYHADSATYYGWSLLNF